MSSSNNDIEKRFQDKQRHSTIVAIYEGNYVRYSRGLENEDLVPKDITTVKEFEKMLQEEEWREVT
jgi:hypothetical protein